MAAPYISNSPWPIIDLTRAASLTKTVEHRPAGSIHRFHDTRTGQSFGAHGPEEAGRLGLALGRLRGIAANRFARA